MKRMNVLAGFSCFLVLSVPVLLTGCDSMGSPFGQSEASYRYEKPDYRNATPTITNTGRETYSHKEVKDVKMVEPGIATVKTPAVTTPSTTTTVTSDTPMVPGAAPVLGQ